MAASETACFAAIDIGSSQVRASVLDATGKQLSIAHRDIGIECPKAGWFVQDSEEIWEAILKSLELAVDASGRKADVRGVGVAATCSMVIVNGDGSSASSSGDVLMWMDHRAVDEAAVLTASGAPCLAFLGGSASPEHQMPKMAWLMRHWPSRLRAASALFDLSDWVVWKLAAASHASAKAAATASVAPAQRSGAPLLPQDAPRSACTTTCKWGYVGHNVQVHGSGECASAAATPASTGPGEWCREGYESLGIGGLLPATPTGLGAPRRHTLPRGQSTPATPAPAIGSHIPVMPVGSAFPRGVSAGVAARTGLPAGCTIAAGLIDAHAGTLGSLMTGTAAAAATEPAGTAKHTSSRMAVVAGTSACHMVLLAGDASHPPLVPGVWGPYYEAVKPGTWLLEAGQSAAGAAVDRIVQGHPAFAAVLEAVAEASQTASQGVPAALYSRLDTVLNELAAISGVSPALLAEPYLVCPDIVGNRSPFANASVRGAIVGVSSSIDEADLARLYLATLQGLALGTRLILDRLKEHGVAVSEIVLSGGLGRSNRFALTLAEACGVKVVQTPEHSDSMLLGVAMAAAAAAG